MTVELVQGTNRVALRTAESGIGIPAELEDRVFSCTGDAPGKLTLVMFSKSKSGKSYTSSTGN